MIITFCGHSDFLKTENYEKELLAILEKEVGNSSAEFYLGGYGNFDDFAYSCCKKFKEMNTNVSLVFVTPYITPEYQKNHLEFQKTKYDSILYPPIEKAPLRFAISYRNKYMVESSDLVIAFIEHEYGGAYQTYKYAKKKGKKIYNLTKQKTV